MTGAARLFSVTAGKPTPSFVQRLANAWIVRHFVELLVSAMFVVLVVAALAASEYTWPRRVMIVALTIGIPLVAVGLRYLQDLRDREQLDRERLSPKSMNSRIDGATDALRTAAGLMDELQAEMNARAAALERIRAENVQYEKLAAVNKEEAEAVSKLIETVIGTAHTRLSRTTRRDQILFFALGLVAGVLVPLVISWLG